MLVNENLVKEVESKYNLRVDLVEITEEDDEEFANEIRTNLNLALQEREELRRELLEDE